MSRVVLAVSILLVGELPRLARADDPDQQLSVARAHWLRGRLDEAIELYSKLVAESPSCEAAVVGLSRCYESRGELDRAAALLDDVIGDDSAADARARRAELAFSRGAIESASDDCQRVLRDKPNHVLARWVQAQLNLAVGDTAAALKECEWLIQFRNRSTQLDAESLVLIGQAAVTYATYKMRGSEQSQQLNSVLNDLYDESIAADADYWPALYQSGRLFLEKHRKGDAIKDLRRALAINPNAAELHAAFGMAAFDEFDVETAEVHADRALAIRPNLPSALRLKADVHMAREQFAEAAEQLEQARRVNPSDPENLGRLAACRAFLGSQAEFAAVCAAAEQRNPRPALFYVRVAERFEDHRRFELAEQYFKRAIAADPDRPDTRTGLGMLYMRIGNESEASATLEQAFEKDPFNVRTKNMLEVLDLLQGYATLETEHFRLKFDQEQDGLLGAYAAVYLEELFGDLTTRFGFSPSERIQIEIFNKGRGETAHRWFSARTVGLPWIGTVGACTGKVVAMTSPNGVDKPFNWARVLKHEVSHVITLQQTNFQIPHWYTEALAVQVEGYPRPALWDQLLLQRLRADDLFNLDNINLAFAHPKSPLDWQMAYSQSELYAAFMRDRFGPDSMSKMLDSYRVGQTTRDAIEHVFGMSLADFELGYRDYLREVASRVHSASAEPTMTLAELEKAVASNPDDADAAARLAAECVKQRNYRKAQALAERATTTQPNHPLGSFVLARLQLVVGNNGKARELLEQALNRQDPDLRVLELLANLAVQAKDYGGARSLYELGVRFYPSESKWIAGVARVALITDNRDELRQALERLCKLDADDQSPRLKLAAMAAEDGDPEQAAHYAWMVLHINAANGAAHRILADALGRQNRWSEAAHEYRVLMHLQPDDLDILIRLARSLHAAGERDGAIAALNQLLEKDPRNAAGRELLDELKR